MTVDAVLARQKTVTRRHADTWGDLKPGDRLTLIEKGMGLKKGEKQVVLAHVEIVSNRVEPLVAITFEDCIAEGFPEMGPLLFEAMWCDSHGVKFATEADRQAYLVRRIEWRYVDG